MSLSNIAKRSITGLFFGAIIVFVCFAPLFLQVIFYGIIMTLCLKEFLSFFRDKQLIKIDALSAYTLQILIYVLISCNHLTIFESSFMWIIVPIIFIIILKEIWRNAENPIFNISVMLFGIGYTLIPFSMLIMLSNLSPEKSTNILLVLGMYILIWSNDTFAYLIGKSFGKRPFFYRISPNKTVEGALGGILLTLLVSLILSILTSELPVLFWFISALIIAPTSIFGDLLESTFKRSVDLKDTGTLIPGHGGILDRFDSFLFTVPFYYFWSLFYLNYLVAQ